jgi:hypothetical protein
MMSHSSVERAMKRIVIALLGLLALPLVAKQGQPALK